MPRLSLAALAPDRARRPRLRRAAPLHERIDRCAAAGEKDFDENAAPVCLRCRVPAPRHLDLTGTIPTAAEARAFLKDSAAGQARPADRPPAGQPRTRPAHGRRLRRDADGTPARQARPAGRVAGVSARLLRRQQAVGRAGARDPVRRRRRSEDAAGRQVLPRPRRRAEPADARHRPAVPGHEPPVRPVPRPSARRRLQAGALLRPVRLPQPQLPVHATRRRT